MAGLSRIFFDTSVLVAGSLAADSILGGRIYDAHIGEVARSAGARSLVTDNRRHFTSLLRHGVRVLTSRELLAELSASPPESL
jgi:predicted nucleic acid-binding protein